MTNQKKNTKSIAVGLSALLLSGALALPMYAQAPQQDTNSANQTNIGTQSAAQSSNQTAPAQVQTGTSASMAGSTDAKQDSADKSSYATGQPLEMQSKEGFWGHVNPFARKKWVNRQITPVKDRVNELDQLQSKNANDIKDVDQRAQSGIARVNAAAQQADQHAVDANNRAEKANGLATTASTRTEALHGTVSNLDQYQQVSEETIKFAPGHTVLGRTAKSKLDDMAQKLGTEKGYIIEVQGYSRAGVAPSDAMADSVVRYLVEEHQVPIFRIYKSGLGRAKAPEGETAVANGVRVTLLHNSLASMDNGQSTVSSTQNPANGSQTTTPATPGPSQVQ